MQNKILIIPGFLALKSFYGGYEGIDIWLKNTTNENISGFEWIVAHSGGVNYLFSNEIPQSQKIILVNPILKKQNLFSLFLKMLWFTLDEGVVWNKIVSISNWYFAFKKIIALLKINVLEEILKLPKENIFIIRGKEDYYYCDEENLQIIKENNLNFLEVSAGHNWDENIAKKVIEITNS